MMNPRRQTASQAVRSVLAALPLVMLSLVQASPAGAAPAPQHDRDHDRGRDGGLARWEFDCTFDFDDRDHDHGRGSGRGGRHDRDDGVCQAIAVVYGVDTDDRGFPAPSGGKEPEIPVTPVVPVPVPISPNRLAVWCDGVGLIYNNAANVANDIDFASVSGYGGLPAVVFDLDDHRSLKSLLNEDDDDGDDGDDDHGDGRDRKRNRIDAELFTGLGLGIDGLEGSCIVRKNGDDGRWDDFIKTRGPVVQSPRRS